ncbi:M57 family metalloprotease [Psychroserpens sp.]|uniref:M57 family metalloprotease n=1 Tax=Psychroserpens sp. TaxID=2020870 RepID=UPI0039E5B0FC
MNRASCGRNVKEGKGQDGAIALQNNPEALMMLAFFSTSEDRGFGADDVDALGVRC